MGNRKASCLTVCGAIAAVSVACTSSGQAGAGREGGSGGHSGQGQAGSISVGGAAGGAGGNPAGGRSDAGTTESGGAAGGPAAGGGGSGSRGGGGAPVGGSTGGGGGAAGAGGRGAGACVGLFCEDFERGTFDPAVWDVKTFGDQTATVQDKMAAHGRYAAQFHGNPNLLSYALIATRNLPAALRSHHFGRAYLYATPNRPGGHLTLVFAGTAEVPSSRKYLEVAETNGKWQLTWVDFDSAGPTSAAGGPNTQEMYSIGDAASADSPVGKWVCLEWEFNDAPDEVRVYVDGALAWSYAPISFQNMRSNLVGGFSNVSFGYYVWHPGTAAFDVYYDDIVLDTRRVGCLP